MMDAEPETTETPETDGMELSAEVTVFTSFEEMDEVTRRQRHAMTPYERTLLLDELRRARYPDAYRNPPTFLEPLVEIQCPWAHVENVVECKKEPET